jgi:NADH:ubiquinone oxidoreductase subunit 3 (subunit A)
MSDLNDLSAATKVLESLANHEERLSQFEGSGVTPEDQSTAHQLKSQYYLTRLLLVRI